MQVIQTKSDLRSAIAPSKQEAKKIALVPTMGNLHTGHMSLVNQALSISDIVVVSIFVNPMQFGENEDFAEYPRTLKADLEQLKSAGVNLVFTPKIAEIYTKDVAISTKVEVPGVSSILCGKTRPVFFIGIATVVTKLFNIVTPDIAVFGRKDFQQLHIIKRMVRELDFPIKIIAADTVRDTDGLAISSRNNYLNRQQRAVASQLFKCISSVAEDLIANIPIHNIEQKNVKKLENAGFKTDYFTIRDKITLGEPDMNRDMVALAAAWLGNTRLIDNVIIRRKTNAD